MSLGAILKREPMEPEKNQNIERQVFSFGQNSYGELGHGDTIERHLPTEMTFCQGKDIVQVAAGNEHTAILTAAGVVYCCGYNDSGQCGLGSTARVPTITVLAALEGKQVSMIHSANGCEHLCMVTMDGELYACGYNARGQLGLGTTTHISTPRLVDGLFGHRVVKVACSYYHTIIATDTDQVFGFGRNDFGQLGLGDTLDKCVPHPVEALHGRGITAIACGQYHTVVGVVSGGLYGFGKNDYGQLGVENSEPTPRPVLVCQPLSDAIITVLACGYYHTAALNNRGEVYTFGRNDFGQLGLGHRENSWRPVLVKDLQGKHIREVAAGCYHTVTLSKDGKVYPFGRNNHGQLGTDTNVDSTRPCFVEALASKFICQVAAGFYHTLCLAGPLVRPMRAPVTNTLSSDLRALINNPARSDVTFIVEGRPVYGHRSIIMARCEPLERMLDGPMREATVGDIPMPGHSLAVFLGFLEFLYTDEVTGLEPANVELDFALDLLSIADQYLVEALKRKCENAIQKSITVENASEMLLTADSRQALSLRRRCFDFILLNFGQVLGTEGWANLPSSLLREVSQAASERGVQVGKSMGAMNLPGKSPVETATRGLAATFRNPFEYPSS